MAAKKKKMKIEKKAAYIPETRSVRKIVLPAFGLAEDILGMQENGSAQEPMPEYENTAMQVAEQHFVQPLDERNQNKPAIVADLHLVMFHLDTEEYGVDIGRVQEIIRVGQITAVPNAPEFIRGVINLRGRIIPVLDLRKRLALPGAPMDKYSRIMVVETGTKVLGLLVDRVSQVVRLPQSSVDAPPEDIEESRSFVRGIGKLESRLIMIVELDRVLAKDARQASALQHPI